MRISDAAVKGRELIDPRSGNDLYPPDEGERYAGCYRGMALVGAGAVQLPVEDDGSDGDYEGGYELVDVLMATWPWVGKVTVHTLPCTCTGKTYEDFRIHQALAHLWDRHVMDGDGQAQQADPWTFERITEWVRSIEPPDQPADAPQA